MKNRITLDASVAVKWFKEREEKYLKEANKLLDLIVDFEVYVYASEWISLEVVRGLKKAQIKGLEISNKKIEGAYRCIEDFFLSDAIIGINVSSVKDLAKTLEIKLGLYAADSVHLATAIITESEYLVTQDRHLLKENVKKFAKKHKVETISLHDYFERSETKEDNRSKKE